MPLAGFQQASKQAKYFKFWGGRRESNPALNANSTRYRATDGSFAQIEQRKAVVTAGEWQVDSSSYLGKPVWPKLVVNREH
jgi:hypothetical protein